MLDGRAVGYLLKEEAPEAIVAAVRAAARGEGYFSPGVAGKVEAWTRGEPPGGLTDREFDVLRLVAEGLTNRQIAQALDIAERTVGFHVSNVLELGVASRTEAVAWGWQHDVAELLDDSEHTPLDVGQNSENVL
jgi:DNA-binding NarL/FixJ family response regulator